MNVGTRDDIQIEEIRKGSPDWQWNMASPMIGVIAIGDRNDE